MKTVAILLALINSLAAGLVIAASIPSVQPHGQVLKPVALMLSAMRVGISIGIIAAGILTWVAVSRTTQHSLMFATGLFLVALGTASGVWTVHLALSDGHVKDQLFLYGGSLTMQGIAALWNLLQAARGHAVV